MANPTSNRIESHRRRANALSKAFAMLCLLSTLFCVGVLLLLLSTVFYHGWNWPNLFPGRSPPFLYLKRAAYYFSFVLWYSALLRRFPPRRIEK
ncbi:MAG: hypothetical protein AAF589_05895 [Planctomycetota bacterium]